MTRAIRLAGIAAALLAGVSGFAYAQAANWPVERPPRPLASRDVKFPPYQVRMLPNGLQVIAVSHHEQPAVSLRLIVRAGGAQDPRTKPGVAALAAALLDQGTTTKDAEHIASTIDSIGGALGTGAGTDLTFINAVVMKDSLDLALDMVSEIARQPKFAPEEIERQRQQILSGLKVSYEDPDYLAGVVFDRLVYGFHPYGQPSSGTPQSIASIGREDLQAFHKTWFGANNAILAIVGDVTPDEAFAGAARAFGDWEKVENSAAKSVDPPSPTRRVIVIDRPGAVQTEIRVGNLALPRKHPDYLALDLATKILGGEGGNRLHRVLRSERGLTYGAAADVHALKESGDIVADTDTRSDSTAEALRLIVDEIWRLQRQRVHPRELNDAQAYLTGNFPLTIETPSAIAMQVLNAVFYGLDLEELQTYRERVNAVTPDDIQRVAREYLHPDRLSIVLVGDASVFASQLPGAGFDQFERISLAELDLASVDLRRRAEPSGLPDAAVSAATGGRVEPARFAGIGAPHAVTQDPRDLIDRAVKAKGGLSRLRAIRTLKAESTLTFEEGGRRVHAPTTIWIRYPDAFRVDAKMPAGDVTQVFAAGEFWVKDHRGVRDAPEAMSAQMLGNIQRDAVPLLLALAEGRVTATRTSVDAQGSAMPALEVGGPGVASVTLIFDPVTALIARQRFPAPSAVGRGTIEEVFSDYRNVDGVQVAFTAVVQLDGAMLFERVVRRVQYNVPLDPNLFVRPS